MIHIGNVDGIAGAIMVIVALVLYILFFIAVLSIPGRLKKNQQRTEMHLERIEEELTAIKLAQRNQEDEKRQVE